MDAGFFAEAALVKGQAKSILNIAEGSGPLSGGAVNAAAAGSGKDPDGVAVSLPVLTEPL